MKLFYVGDKILFLISRNVAFSFLRNAFVRILIYILRWSYFIMHDQETTHLAYQFIDPEIVKRKVKFVDFLCAENYVINILILNLTNDNKDREE